MKTRTAGKIIKHKERYSCQHVQTAYETLIRHLRKHYMRMYRERKGCSNYYVHKACEPGYFLVDDVNEIWNVNTEV